jgi:hypothetical protein
VSRRLLHYIDLMSRPENAGAAPGLVSVKPLGDGTFEILDGHHRVLAHVMTGRGEVLCLVIEKSKTRENPGTEVPGLV